MKSICYWPDGTWCNFNELDDYCWKSDDYSRIEISYEIDDDEIDRIVDDLIRG